MNKANVYAKVQDLSIVKDSALLLKINATQIKYYQFQVTEQELVIVQLDLNVAQFQLNVWFHVNRLNSSILKISSVNAKLVMLEIQQALSVLHVPQD